MCLDGPAMHPVPWLGELQGGRLSHMCKTRRVLAELKTSLPGAGCDHVRGRCACVQVYFENWKEKNIFADLFNKPDTTGIDPSTLDLFKQECKKDKLIFTASCRGPHAHAGGPPADP